MWFRDTEFHVKGNLKSFQEWQELNSEFTQNILYGKFNWKWHEQKMGTDNIVERQ